MRLELAHESDSDRLKAFFARMLLPGAMDLSVERRGQFFDHYRLQSDDFETMMLLDNRDEIQGIATLLFREGIIHSERQTLGFASDLRIAPTRSAVLQWAQHFLPVLERARETRNCRYVFSAVERGDNPAYNTLIRPQHIRRNLPRYHLLRRFHIVAIHGRLPFQKKPLPSIRLTRLDTSTLSELCNYLRSRAQDRAFSLINDEQSVAARVARFPGLNLEDVRIARDARDRIIGCVAPWSSASTQSFVPMRYHGFAATVQQTLRLLSWTRLLRPLPTAGTPFHLRFLTLLHADSPEVFHRLADDAFASLADDELLTYAHYRGHLPTLPPSSYICTSLPYALHTLLPSDVDLPEALQPDPWLPPPEFEIASM